MNQHTDNFRYIQKQLKDWYITNKRDLPWRNTRDPYKIWISEIILQQTRVNQGIDYYYKFIERFPNVNELALASEEEVLKYWQGLGYYSRARNLHFTAQLLKKNYNGVFPTDFNTIKSLKGIGEYTAAAIASFCFNAPHAVVDGNVYRVLSRLYGIADPINTSSAQKKFSQLANKLLPTNDAATHNQAIMEFGALHCTPTQPQCENCSLNNVCIGYNTHTSSCLPVKIKNKAIRERHFNYLFIKTEQGCFIQKRTNKDIWKHLYEFPLVESNNILSTEALVKTTQFKNLFVDLKNITINQGSRNYKHILSHQHILGHFYFIQTQHKNVLTSENLLNVTLEELHSYPISRLTELFLDEHLDASK